MIKVIIEKFYNKVIHPMYDNVNYNNVNYDVRRRARILFNINYALPPKPTAL